LKKSTQLLQKHIFIIRENCTNVNKSVNLKNEKLPRIALNMTQEMYDQLQAEADKRGATMANLVREYILRGLAADGHTVEHYKVTWGGNRRSKDESD
jgi:hypothetical protein